METTIEIGGSQFLKINHILARRHQFLRFFSEIYYSVNNFSEKWKSIFLHPSSSLCKRNFWLVETVFFFVAAILLLEDTIIGKQFSKKDLILASEQLIFWLVKTAFFSIFSETTVSDTFFRVVEE